MDVFVVRHGESIAQAGQPWLEYTPLSELGREQARRAGVFLKDAGITRVYCSPILRAFETGAILAGELGLAPHGLIELCEWGGVWPYETPQGRVWGAGEPRSLLLEVCPMAVLPESVTEEGWWHERVEPGSDAMFRVARDNADAVVNLLRTNHLPHDEPVALVAHGGSGSTLISALLGFPPTPEYVRFGQYSAAISLVRVTESRARLDYGNRVDHLSPEQVTHLSI